MPGVRFDVAVFRHPAQRGEAGGMNASSRLGDDAVGDREHRRIAADHQGNQDHGRGADRRRLRQDPAADAEILRQLFERRRNPDRSSVLFRDRDIAERAPGGGHGLCRRQAAFRLKPRLLGQVEPDLVVHLAIRACGKKQRALNPHSKPAPRRHRFSPVRVESRPKHWRNVPRGAGLQAGPSTLAMAADTRLQRVRSSASCRRPAAVMR